MSDHAHHGPDFLAHHFDSPKQQFETAKVGLWLFLGQEILFFSGLFVAYFIFRSWYPEAWSVGSHLLDWKWGATNTVVLLASSFTAAMAVRAAQIGEQKGVPAAKRHALGGQKWTGNFLIITFICAGIFMVVKYFEYTHKFHVGTLPGQYFGCPWFDCSGASVAEGAHHLNAELSAAIGTAYETGGPNMVPFHLRSFFGLYFVMTGLHGIHVLIGMGLIAWIWNKNRKGEFSAEYNTPVDGVALYWHLVDLVWIFLFPLLYLID